MLAYVFVVPANPHGLPMSLEGVPTSTLIFVWGLTGLTISAFYSFVLAKCLTVVLRDKARGPRHPIHPHPRPKPNHLIRD